MGGDMGGDMGAGWSALRATSYVGGSSLTGLATFFSAFYNFNLQFQEEAACTLKITQRYDTWKTCIFFLFVFFDDMLFHYYSTPTFYCAVKLSYTTWFLHHILRFSVMDFVLYWWAYSVPLLTYISQNASLSHSSNFFFLSVSPSFSCSPWVGSLNPTSILSL